MKDFNFYFEIKKDKKVSLDEEKNIVEIELYDLGQGMLFSSSEFQETRFQKLTLPVTSQVRKALLENDITKKQMVIKNIKGEPTLRALDETTLRLNANTFGAVEIVNSENENPFDPLEIDWDKWDGNGNKKEGWKSWRMWWNPRDMKFWNPPLTPNEQEKYLNDKEHDYYKAWEVYKNRLNQQNRKLDLYFQINNTDKSHTASGFECDYKDQWVIKIFSWPPFVPPSEIKELIPNNPRMEEFDNLAIGRIDLVFDNQDENNMKLFHQWDNLLKKIKPNQKFVIRNIPLKIEQSWYALDNFHDFYKLDWQNWHKKGDEEPQWEETRNADFMSKVIYRGKKVRAIQIATRGLEEQLKLEKVSEEEYSKHNDSSKKEFNEEKDKLRKYMENNNIEKIILQDNGDLYLKKYNDSGSILVDNQAFLPNVAELKGVDIKFFFQKVGKKSITGEELGLSDQEKSGVKDQNNFDWIPWVIVSVLISAVIFICIIVVNKKKKKNK